MNKKRILLFTMGNWSHSNEALVKALHDRSPDWEIHTIDLLQQFRQRKHALLFCMLDIPVLLWRALLDGGFDKTNILYAPFTSRYINRLARSLVREHKPDFTLQTTTRFNACNTGVPHFTIIDITVAAGRPSYRNLFHSSEHALNMLDSFQHKVYACSTGVFSMGGYVRDSLVSDYQVPPYRAHSIGAGPNIDLGHRSDVTASRKILFVGTDWQRKGGPDLLAAFRKVRQNHQDATLEIIGCNPDINEGGVRVVGRVPRHELHNYFSTARMFALPTVHEAFGIVFVEALHFGLPIVATSIGAIPEMVRHGVNGYRVKPGDVEALANALDQLLSDDELADAFGEASYEHAIKFSWDAAAEVLVDKINELIEHDKPKSTPGHRRPEHRQPAGMHISRNEEVSA